MAVIPPIQDLWSNMLRILDWAWRIPLTLLVIFASCCGSFLGFMFIYRATAWVFIKFLVNPWN